MRLSANFWRSLLLGSLLLTVAGVEPVQVVVRPQVSVSADHATLSDVAELKGDPAITAILAGLPIVQLPDLSAKSIDGLVITKAIGRSLGDRFQVQGSGTVTRQALTLSQEVLAQAAKSAISINSDEVEISVLRHSGAVAIPAGGDYQMVADALDKQLSGDIPVRVRVMRGERELGRALVTLRVVRYRPVVTAARTLRRGQVIGASDLQTQRVVTTARNSTAATDLSILIGQEVRVDVEAGSHIQATMVLSPPAVRAGQTIELVVTSAYFQVSGVAVALGTGAVGDVINVRRQADGHTVRGRIIGLGSVAFER